MNRSNSGQTSALEGIGLFNNPSYSGMELPSSGGVQALLFSDEYMVVSYYFSGLLIRRLNSGVLVQTK